MSNSFAREVQKRLKAEGIEASIEIIKQVCIEEHQEGSLTDLEIQSVQVVVSMLIRNAWRISL
jgi:hypothetical protein